MSAPKKRRIPAGTGLKKANNVGGQVDYSLIANDCASTKKLPPYARETVAAIATGKPPNLYVFTGPRAWERAQRRRTEHGVGSAIVVEQDALAGAYDWRFLSGLAVVLSADQITVRNRPALIALAAELVAAGVRFAAASDGVETFAARGCSS
jgi:hypothetical protein